MFWWQQKRLCPSCPSPRRSSLQPGKVYLIYSGACRKEATLSRPVRKSRIGEQAGWESTGPGQTGVRNGLAIKNNLYKATTRQYFTCSPGFPNKMWQGYNRTLATKGNALWGGEKPGKSGSCMTNSC